MAPVLVLFGLVNNSCKYDLRLTLLLNRSYIRIVSIGLVSLDDEQDTLEGKVDSYVVIACPIHLAFFQLLVVRIRYVIVCPYYPLTLEQYRMDGELHDYKFPNEKSIYDQRTRQASYLSLTAFSMIAGYYCVVFPYLKLTRGKARRVTPLGNQPHRRKMSYDPTLRLEHPIPAVFDSWADYEDLHLLFWLGKDFAWIWELQILWIAFIGPTFFIGVDFVWKSLMTRRMMIDHAHYVAQFLWVLSNATWACGELFLSLRYDDPTELIGWNDSYSRRSARWYASWILVGAFVPLVALYAIWLGGTVRGRIVSPPELLEWKGKSTLSEPLMSR